MTTVVTDIFSCCCCGDEIDLNNALTCPAHHVSCVTCLERALQVAVGELSLVRCFYPATDGGCNNFYNETAIIRATQDCKLRKAYDSVVSTRTLQDAGIYNDGYKCPYCDNVVFIEADINIFTTFHCNSCEKDSCRKCKRERHEGSCNKDRQKEEELTERLIYRCYCGAPCTQEDGCNKMKCQICRKAWCWICKGTLQANPYDHFYNPFHPYDKNQVQNKCPLYGARPENQVFREKLNNVTTRKRILDDGTAGIANGQQAAPVQNLIVGYGITCCQSETQPEQLEQPQRKKKRRDICKGILITTGAPCRYKSKADGYCLHHIAQKD